jgi:hypothetical protein
VTGLGFADVRRRVQAFATRPHVASGAIWIAWAIAFGYAYICTFGGAFIGDWSLFGTHDWDSHVAYRYISVLSLREYGEMPWFSPWWCHGFPAWAYVEGATNILSPYLPLYLFAPIAQAARIEALGTSFLGLLGAFLLARRYTRSLALASFVAFVYVLNSRWALQFQAGHTWHLQYAWVPWIFFLFDKSCREGSVWHAVGAGVMAGLVVTTGGIYPAPHTAVAFPVYLLGMMLADRSWLPLGRAVVMGLSAIGFAAPKLVPLVLLMERFPRLVYSDESLSLNEYFSLLTRPKEFHIESWGWHENSSFIGVGPVLVILFALLLPSPRRTRAFRVLGVLFALLGMGAFARYAPWTWLHEHPPFASQHVPTRFMLMGLLFSGIDAAATFSALFDSFFRRFRRFNVYYRWFDAALLLGVVLICQPMFEVSRGPIRHTFERRMLPFTPAEKFEHTDPIKSLDYKPRHGFGAVLPAMMANIGADKKCHTVPIPPIGAINKSRKNYKGEAYFAEGTGKAEVVKFTPNSAEVRFEGAVPGELLMYNMNYHPGWLANGKPAIEARNAVGIRVPESSGTMRFVYRPPGLTAGLSIGALFVLVVFYARYGASLQRRYRERVRARREPKPQAQHEPLIGA